MRLTKSAGKVISDAPIRNLEGLGRLQYLPLAATVALDRSGSRPQSDL